MSLQMGKKQFKLNVMWWNDFMLCVSEREGVKDFVAFIIVSILIQFVA